MVGLELVRLRSQPKSSWPLDSYQTEEIGV